MSGPAQARCRRCGRLVAEARLDPEHWCADCRAWVISRATPVGHVGGALGAIGLLVLLFLVVRARPGYLIVWLVLAALLYWFLFRLVRRVAFSVIRSHAARRSRDA
ncbi:MAG TPA: hypothetical protein VFL93_17600 [Longimicrobiaceae bacterium]|nr:hypothetical protein [Longimicrobiaceae bacterium]